MLQNNCVSVTFEVLDLVDFNQSIVIKGVYVLQFRDGVGNTVENCSILSLIKYIFSHYQHL